MRFGPAIFFSWCASASLLRVNLDEKRRHAGNASDVRVTSSRSISTCAGTSGHGTSVYTCDQDTTHRVCATLVQSTSPCTAKQWGSSGTFWDITGQSSWKDDVCGEPNPGTGWCISMFVRTPSLNGIFSLFMNLSTYLTFLLTFFLTYQKKSEKFNNSRCEI